MTVVAKNAPPNMERGQFAHLSELDRFILTRYDPLLQIVKQLTSQIHELEANVARWSALLARGEDPVRGHSLEIVVGQLRADHSEALLTRAQDAARLASLEVAVSELAAAVPSSARSEQWCDSDANQDEMRLDRLEAAVRSLSANSHNAKDKQVAKKERSINQERHIHFDPNYEAAPKQQHPRSHPRQSEPWQEILIESIPDNAVDLITLEDDEEVSSTPTYSSSPGRNRTLNAASAPWLFKVSPNVPITAMQGALGFDEVGSFTAELDAKAWTSEFDMWCDLAASLACFRMPPANSRKSRKSAGRGPDPFKSFCVAGDPNDRGSDSPSRFSVSVDVEEDCKQSALEALAISATTEILFIVRSVPGKEELRDSGASPGNPLLSPPPSGGVSALSRIECVASFVVAAQQQVRHRAPMTTSRLSVVLVGNGIGRSLRAGSKKFPIDPLL